MVVNIEVDITSLKALFNDFFTSIYKPKINDLLVVYPTKKSIEVDYADLERFDPDLADKVVTHPDIVLEAAKEAIKDLNLTLPGLEKFEPNIRFFNMSYREILIENLKSKNLNEMVCFKGVITRRAETLHKVKLASFTCQVCDSQFKLVVTKNFIPPKRCDSCKKLALQQSDDDSTFSDIQRAETQELLERVRGGAPSAKIELLLEDDLVNSISPGDNVDVVGILRLKPPLKTKQKQELIYGRYVEVISVKSLKRDFEEVEITKEDEKRILDFSKNPNIEKILIASLAPGIYGHNEVKKAIALQLFGGTRGKTMGGMRIRDDIHILLIGDPGSAKSRFLQQVGDIAPKSIYVSGKSTSGAGLCVSGDSLLTFNDAGIFEIGSYIEQKFKDGKEELKNAFSCPNNSKVSSFDSGLRSSFEPSSKIWKIKSPENMVFVKTSNGKELKLTPNTPLLVLNGKELSWIKSSELKCGDFVATSGKVKPFDGKKIPIFSLIKNKNVKIADCSEFVCEITDKLMLTRNTDLTHLAKEYGILRDRFYRWRSKKWNQGVSLSLLKQLAIDAGFSEEVLASKIKKCFIRYGKTMALPAFLEPNLAYYAGLIAGDGDIIRNGHSGPVVRLHNNDKCLLNKVSSFLSDCFDIKSRLIDDGKRVTNLVSNSEVLADLMEGFGIPAGEKSSKVNISNSVVSAGREIVASFLRGLFDTDGWVSYRKDGSSSVGFSTCSKKMAYRVFLLLEWWGISANLRKRVDRLGQETEICGKKVISKSLQYQVDIRGINNIKKFSEHIGFSKKNKKEVLSILLTNVSGWITKGELVPLNSFIKHLHLKYKIPARKLGDNIVYSNSIPSKSKIREIAELVPNGQDKDLLLILADSDIVWDEIKETRSIPADSEWVYDLTVDQSHAFFANGILVHNTVTAEKDDLGDGGWTLKAGALVLASGGMAQIDEFDKIDDEDRASMHEAMESGQISVAKAGIVAKFKSKTSILAAANPKYGRFDQNKNLADQFAIPPTLLSRFDLIFPIVDILDEEKDSKLAQHILSAHMGIEKKPDDIEFVDKDLLRKYIAYARRHSLPILTQQALEKIKEFYVDLRRKGKDTGSVAITPRYLEGLVRLAEANAKMRLSTTVDEADAETSINLMEYVMKKVMTDKATGVFDVDVVATGKPKSERDKLEKVDIIIDIIKDQLNRHDSAEIEAVVSDAASYGVDDKTARRILSELLRKGEIYEKEHGHIRLVGG